MRSLFLLIPVSFLLNGCLVGELEQVAKDTRDQVRETKEGAQLSTALEICLGSEISESARVAACKPALLKLPDDRLADYMGLPMRILTESSVRRTVDLPTVGTLELELPNVLYVGEGVSRDFRLELAPTSEELHHVLHMAVLQAISDIGAKAMKPGLSGEETETYRGYGRRLIFVSTAILGAVSLRDVHSSLEGGIAAVSQQTVGMLAFQETLNRQLASLPKVASDRDRAHAVKGLRTLARNLSLPESELNALQVLSDVRMGVRY